MRLLEWFPRRPLFAVLLVLALAAAPFLQSCSRSDAPVKPQSSTLITRVDALLLKEQATPEDISFIESLTQDQITQILAHYSAHPRSADPTPALAPGLGGPAAAPEAGVTATEWQKEWIECRDGSGGTRASGWFHTTLCGGDADDHFYLHPSIPGAYANRGYLQGRTTNPAILLVLATYGWRLSARVYDSDNIYLCVGSRIHWMGVSHDTWKNGFFVYRVN